VRLRAMLDQRIDAGEAVGGNIRTPPLNERNRRRRNATA
jgi:hypothetical protein